MSEEKEQTLKICKGECHLPWEQWLKRGAFTVFAIIFLAVAYFLLKTLYEGKNSVESVLSIILALFSMSMSAFFYFKADEAGKGFYKSSYDFMKKQSEFLGVMNERFGQKFDNLTDNVKIWQMQKNEVEAKIQENQTSTQENSTEMIDTLKKQNEEYKTLYENLTKELSEKIDITTENTTLKSLLENARNNENYFKKTIKAHEEKLKLLTNEKFALQMDLQKIRDKKNNIRVANPKFRGGLSIQQAIVERIMREGNCKKTPYFNFMYDAGFCDEDGILTKDGEKYIIDILE